MLRSSRTPLQSFYLLYYILYCTRKKWRWQRCYFAFLVKAPGSEVKEDGKCSEMAATGSSAGVREGGGPWGSRAEGLFRRLRLLSFGVEEQIAC